MAVRLTKHATEQISYRGNLAGFDESEVVAAVSEKERDVRRALRQGADEVRVVVKTVTGTVTLQDGSVGVMLPDGSNGQVVLACTTVDGAGNVVVKTVMLQRSRQVYGKQRHDGQAYI